MLTFVIGCTLTFFFSLTVSIDHDDNIYIVFKVIDSTFILYVSLGRCYRRGVGDACATLYLQRARAFLASQPERDRLAAAGACRQLAERLANI